MEKNSNKILLTVLGIAVLVVATIGATFAYFSAADTANAQSVTTGVLNLTASSTAITNQSVKPTTFAIGSAKTNADIGHGTVTVDTAGTTVTGAYYDIVLDGTLTALDESKNGGFASDVKWAVYDGENKIGEGTFADATNKTVGTVNIETAGSKTYDLYIYVLESGEEQNQLQGVTASATITAKASTQIR